MSTPARASALAVLAAASSLALAGCGGTTVESDDVTTTAAATTTTAATTVTSAASTVTSTSAAAPARNVEDPALANEGPASEVTDAPAPVAARPEKDEAYLEALRTGGINVDGNEDQLIGTARTVCDGSVITRDAVAGQLIEQERTTLDQKDAAALIDRAANAHLC